ncbi:MAG: fasciclin domain-containing protein [Planctomycetes bacterium]|nr:fasciclin domain-containing protein [Planctomycetota bacterium]
MKAYLLLPLAMATALTVGCSSSNSSASTSLGQTLAAKGFPTLQAAIDAAGLTQTLTSGGDFTILAPTEAAFGALPAGTLDFLLEPANQATLRAILEYHVIPGIADSTVVSGLSSATTVQGGLVLIDSVSGGLRVNEAGIEEVDITASNGVIHSIDTVLMPPMDVLGTLQARGFNTLLTALDAAGLQPTFAGTDNYTILAPTDEAFANLPAGALADLLLPANLATLQDVLTYHVVDGSVTAGTAVGAESPKALNGVTLLFADSQAGATVNEVSISMTNIPCTNGVIHVLDAVLLPAGDIPTVAVERGFSTLAQALTAAGLIDDLQADGPFTVFAPTDAAFAALPPGILEDLLLPANQADLISVLLYHVVADELTAQEVLGGTSFTSLQGADLAVTANPAQVGGADISATNVLARNGIVHAIDSVLIPPGFFPLAAEDSVASVAAGIENAAEFAYPTQWSDLSAPLWGGSLGSQQVVFGDFGARIASPVRPLEGKGAVLHIEGLGWEGKADGSMESSLAGSLRIALDWDVVPTEVQLDLLLTGTPDSKGMLVLAFADGTVQTHAPNYTQEGSDFSTSTWEPDRAGSPLVGADLLVERSQSSPGVRGVRIHSLND